MVSTSRDIMTQNAERREIVITHRLPRTLAPAQSTERPSLRHWSPTHPRPQVGATRWATHRTRPDPPRIYRRGGTASVIMEE